MRADVVEPVGLNANWSQNEFEYSGLRRMGYKNDAGENITSHYLRWGR